MSFANQGTVKSRKSRMMCIQKRTEASTMPPMDNLFSTFAKKGNGRITKDVVENVYFSQFPPKDASMALSALSMNSRNIAGMRESGSLGVVIDMLRRVDFGTCPDSTHVADLVRSISILTEDRDTQERLMSNPHGVAAMLRLCLNTTGKVQERIFHVMDNMCRTDMGMEIFLQHNVFDVLLSPEMLCRSSTLDAVKIGTAQLVNRVATVRPEKFPVERLEEVMLVNGVRTVDGAIEMQLLSALLSHLTWLTNEKLVLAQCSSIFVHLINEIKTETFEDLEHLLQCLKCIMIVSRDKLQGGIFMENNLGVALQYVVRTDFELWRKVRTQAGGRPHTAGTSGPAKKKSGTQATLDAIRGSTAKKSRKIDDINFKTTRLVVLIYENVMQLGLQVVGNIVSSGLISGLLFRVGTGKNVDRRFLRLVTHFLYLLLVMVVMEQPSNVQPLSMVRHVQPNNYTRAGSMHHVANNNNDDDDDDDFFINKPKAEEVQETIDIRSVSNKLHVQGVTPLLIFVLEGDEYECVSDAITSLAVMSFQVIKTDVMKEHILHKICHYTLLRQDCFFEGLQLLGHSIISPPADHFPDFVTKVVTDMNAITILVKAMKLSGWIFHQKSIVYEAMSMLTCVPQFVETVRKCRGINALVYEVDVRKRWRLYRRKNHLEVDEDGATDRLYAALKEDWGATRIQAMCRSRGGRKKAVKAALLLQQVAVVGGT